MPALVAGIHVLQNVLQNNDQVKDVDGRNKSGHDVRKSTKELEQWISATVLAI
jgi:hypothetical protein